MSEFTNEHLRGELRTAAIAFSSVLEVHYDEDNYVNVVTRLEVAAKAFADSELLKDKARLDWLESMQAAGIDFDICNRKDGFYVSDLFDPDAHTPAFPSFRQAIDEATKRITPPGNPDGAS